MKLWNFKGEKNTISEALRINPPEHSVISFTGAGGKTTLIFAWAQELAAAGKKVIVTTTTHMYGLQRMQELYPNLMEGVSVIEAATASDHAAITLSSDIRSSHASTASGEYAGEAAITSVLSQAKDAFRKSSIVMVVSADPERPEKVVSPSETVLEKLYEIADITLIEADGARRMPLKWPAPWEPVVPLRSDYTVCVAGLSALGRRPEEVIFRCEDMPENFLLRRIRAGAGAASKSESVSVYEKLKDASPVPKPEPERVKLKAVDEQLINALITSLDGGQKGAAGDFRVFLNQADDAEKQRAAAKLQMMLGACGIQSAWGSLSEFNESNLKIAIILEAAGNSSRFGSNKLLHVLNDGKPMVCHILDAVRKMEETETRASEAGSEAGSEVGSEAGSEARSEVSLGCRKFPGNTNFIFTKILITQYDEVAALAPDFRIVMNDRPDLGISHSMQLGIEAAGDADAYMFCVCDQPGIKTSTIWKLIEAYEANIKDNKKGTAGIVSLSWMGKMCNPKIFSSKYRDELMALSGDTGGRQIIESHKDELLLVEADARSETEDIDRNTGRLP